MNLASMVMATAFTAALAQGDGATDLRIATSHVAATEQGGLLRWNSRWVLAVGGPTEGVVRFAEPLPEGERMEPEPGIAEVLRDGRVVGLAVTSDAVHGREFSTTFSQPASSVRAGVLGPPLAEGSAVQMVDLRLSGGARLEVDTPGVERRLGYSAPAGISPSARREAERLSGHAGGVTGGVLFVRGDDVRRAHGLHGARVEPRERAHSAVIGASLLFALVLTVLLVASRTLGKRATLERAEAILARECERPGGP